MVDAGILEDLEAADDAARKVVPRIVMRYREAGVLTWALMHRIEAEVLDELEATGVHPEAALSMIRSSPLLQYPKDDRPASFGNAAFVPIIFGRIEGEWKRVH
ncbi:MAG: DUF2471 family protein [Xanthobacteraceae bacterium]